MQLETALSPEIVGRAAYSAVREANFAGVPLMGWTDLAEGERDRWSDVATRMLTDLGLHIVAEDVIAEQAAVSASIVEVGGEKYMRDGKGNLIALSLVKPQRQLEDETVRKVMRFAIDLSAQVARFKGHTFEDLNALQSLLEQHYGAKAGGKKGNVTFSTFDDTMRVEVKIADQLAFGPELQSAKKLVDECLIEWGADSHAALRALVNKVFSVEKEGQINRGELFSLLAMEIEDKRWQSAMEAIRDSIRVIGSKTYLRFRERDDQGAWSTVTIDLAAA